MSDAPTITVTGEATVPVRTDRATLGVTVTVRDEDQQACLSRRREAVAVARRVLERAGLLRQDNEQVRESVAHDRSHQATWSVELVLPDATVDTAREQLVEVISRLAGVSDCQVSGPSWSLNPATRQAAHGQALERATAQAREQAETIARALGASLGDVASVRTYSRVPDPVGGVHEVGRVALAAATEPLPERTLETAGEPTTEDVSASVEAVFHTELPT